jgi:hypothetical protein
LSFVTRIDEAVRSLFRLWYAGGAESHFFLKLFGEDRCACSKTLREVGANLGNALRLAECG